MLPERSVRRATGLLTRRVGASAFAHRRWLRRRDCACHSRLAQSKERRLQGRRGVGTISRRMVARLEARRALQLVERRGQFFRSTPLVSMPASRDGSSLVRTPTSVASVTTVSSMVSRSRPARADNRHSRDVEVIRLPGTRGRSADLGGLPSTPCGTHLSTDARANSEAAMTRTPRLFRTAGPPATLWRGAAIVTLLALGSLPAAALSAGSSKAPKLRSKAPCSTPQTLPTSVAGTPGAFAIVASTGHVGCIALLVTGATAPSVTVSETNAATEPGVPLATLPTSSGSAALTTGITWRCDRLIRTFTATETLAEGNVQAVSASVATPSCSDRLRATAPTNRLHRGYPVTVSLADRWGLGGIRVMGCLGSDRRHCAAVTLRSGGTEVPLRLRLRDAGRVLLTRSDAYQAIRFRLNVHDTRPVLLATGDSEMQVLDDDLASDLSGSNGVKVIGEARQSTAISSPFVFNWPEHAGGQVAGDHPDIVAMFLGGNDGFSLSGVACCSEAWSREYAIRVAGMMRVYLQHGAAAVYWCLIPTQSREPFVRVVRAVNDGIILAAARFRHNVHVFDLRPLFSPGGRYIDSLYYGGRTITVHEADGFHLSASSDVIVAHLFIDQLRRDGLIA